MNTLQNRVAGALALLFPVLVGCVGCQASSSTPAPGRVREASAAASKDAAVAPRHTYAKPPVAELQKRLNRIQFEVTQKDATEPPFRNEFWNNHAPGIYVDVATGEPLFSSLDKFESGTGWPSFTRPIEDGHVVSKSDGTLGMERTEVRSSSGDSHLGHVFDDGPAPTGMRYCINSASLRFVPLERLAAEGYVFYAARFGGASGAPLPAATNNACAMPDPGERPGCESTMEAAELQGDPAGAASLREVDGVLDVQAATTGEPAAAHPGVRVVFDPKKIAYADLVHRWLALRGQRSAQ